MTEPNIVNVQAIKSFFLSWDVFLGENVLLTNPTESGQLFKITDIKFSNFDAESTSASIVLERDGIVYHIIKNVNINENATISVLTAESEIILQEGDRIVCLSEEEQQSLSVSISYSVISETSAEHERGIFSLSAPQSIESDETLTISFISRNIPDGAISYEITGVDSSDIDNFPLTGTFNLTNGSAEIQLEIQESAEDKTLTFAIPSLDSSISIEISGGIYDFTAFTFTNGTQTGRFGPSLQNLLSAYDTNENPWLNDTELFNTSDGIQLWTVPANGTYRIAAYGAAGGGTSNRGGNGAIIQGDFSLNAGEVIKILVGQMGFPTTGRHSSGGGGTFVVKNTPSTPTNNDILVIAGGGAGSRNQANTPFEWMHAVAGPDGEDAQNTGGSGGTNGNGGGGGSEGAGGGGFFTDGGNSGNRGGGAAFVNGGVGGTPGSFDEGGFGGGGAAYDSTGGGGGYSGGGGGTWTGGGPNGNSYHFGGGGGSFNNGTNQSAQVGAQNGNPSDGKVEITFLG